MFRTRSGTTDDRVVMTLPDDYLVRRCVDRWVVVGPPGLFVIGRAHGDLEAETRQTASTAHIVRSRLADLLPWVPFVNPVVVADETHHGFSCPVVEVQDLEPVLRSSGRQITDGALQMLRHHVPGVVQDIEFDRAASFGS
ncbi:MAG: hypothetical protein JST64_14735 [Actinobacteria bacterium]|nr:hypothetical protein [Actinomycetota bacterium]